MAENNSIKPEQQKVCLCEQLWLSFFNDYLYGKGMLTEAERNRMIVKIESRKGSIFGKTAEKEKYKES
ncbi:MAG: hypothetical protein IJX01_05870 [Oscillospiraceae bacterium]|nr:hypothetical protein [Oscillospiraceae bacterium]